jgi:hypothetical protein
MVMNQTEIKAYVDAVMSGTQKPTEGSPAFLVLQAWRKAKDREARAREASMRAKAAFDAAEVEGQRALGEQEATLNLLIAIERDRRATASEPSNGTPKSAPSDDSLAT